MIVTYAAFYLIIPALSTGRYIKMLFWTAISIYFALTLARFLKIYVYETILVVDLEKDRISDILTNIPALLGQYMIWVMLTPLLIVMIALLVNHLSEKERLEKLRKEKNNAELRFLKAQIHPHFLFNTLNNLYTLALQKSKKTADIAQKLYDILDYMFNNDSQATIAIMEEVKLIQNYIELEKIRYGERLQLTFDQSIDNNLTPIVPLMLLSMIENAFKHGASGDLGSPEINIKLELNKEQLRFSIYNTKPAKLATDDDGYRKGIGIKNIKRQLNILYPNHYNYKIIDNDTNYTVKLNINLTGYRPLAESSLNQIVA